MIQLISTLKQLPRTWQYGLAIFALSYIAVHLSTLSISPLPWFDETYMASIAQEFIETGKLFPRVAQVRHMDQELIYGPVYFAVTGLFIKLFGFAPFPFRLTAFLSGLLVIWATARLLSQVSPKYLVLFLICLSLDPFLNRSMHEGRMDLFALFFILTASHHFIQFKHTQQYKQVVWAAVYTLLALLTTPRTGFFFTAWFFIWLFWLTSSWKSFAKAASLCLVIILTGYFSWVWYAFGGLTSMLDYYGQYLMFTRLNMAQTSIMKQQYLLILFGWASVGLGFIRFGKSYFTTTVVLAILSVICFYSMVFDQGPYAVFIVPSYYLMIFGALKR